MDGCGLGCFILWIFDYCVKVVIGFGNVGGWLFYFELYLLLEILDLVEMICMS